MRAPLLILGLVLIIIGIGAMFFPNLLSQTPGEVNDDWEALVDDAAAANAEHEDLEGTSYWMTAEVLIAESAIEGLPGYRGEDIWLLLVGPEDEDAVECIDLINNETNCFPVWVVGEVSNGTRGIFRISYENRSDLDCDFNNVSLCEGYRMWVTLTPTMTRIFIFGPGILFSVLGLILVVMGLMGGRKRQGSSYGSSTVDWKAADGGAKPDPNFDPMWDDDGGGWRPR